MVRTRVHFNSNLLYKCPRHFDSNQLYVPVTLIVTACTRIPVTLNDPTGVPGGFILIASNRVPLALTLSLPAFLSL